YGIKTVVKIVFVIQVHHQAVGIICRRKVRSDLPFYFIIGNTGLHAAVGVGELRYNSGAVLFADTRVVCINKPIILRIPIYIRLKLIIVTEYIYGKPLCSLISYFYIGIEPGKRISFRSG